MNPFGRAFELLVQIGFAFKHQLDDDLDGSKQQTVDQPEQNAAEQAEEKTSPVRPDKAPELSQKNNHSGLIFGEWWRKASVLFLNRSPGADRDGRSPGWQGRAGDGVLRSVPGGDAALRSEVRRARFPGKLASVAITD
jgi:hypothetical protein